MVKKITPIARKIESSSVRFKGYENIAEERAKHQIKLILNEISKRPEKKFEFKVLSENHFVERLYFDKNSTRLGEGRVGTIYNGFLKLKGSTQKKRVAIKFFKLDFDDHTAHIYKSILKKLETIKYPSGKSVFPKMGLLKIKILDNYKPIWVGVSSGFIKKVGPTNISKFKRNNAFNYSPEVIKEIEYIYRKVIDLGYSPYDLVAQLKNKGEVVPIDVDMIVTEYMKRDNRLITKKEDKLNEILVSFGKVSNRMGQGSPVASDKIFIELCENLKKNKKEWVKEIQKAISNSHKYSNIDV
ncbi:MAG: hypothetical protein PHX47_03140 [Candidatus ainarchaeum sp.]|nr:hypothetical protein [Candidatus ainarchaeum sp.]